MTITQKNEQIILSQQMLPDNTDYSTLQTIERDVAFSIHSSIYMVTLSVPTKTAKEKKKCNSIEWNN